MQLQGQPELHSKTKNKNNKAQILQNDSTRADRAIV
jgi:hypothetical protein